MSASVTCDNCGKTQHRRGLVGWWAIEQSEGSIEFFPLGARVLTGDYCSTACVAERAAALR